jgi:hypothetical protein
VEEAVWNKLICYNCQRLLHIIYCTAITTVSYHRRGSSLFSGTSLPEVVEVSVTGKKDVVSQPDQKGSDGVSYLKLKQLKTQLHYHALLTSYRCAIPFTKFWNDVWSHTHVYIARQRPATWQTLYFWISTTRYIFDYFNLTWLSQSHTYKQYITCIMIPEMNDIMQRTVKLFSMTTLYLQTGQRPTKPHIKVAFMPQYQGVKSHTQKRCQTSDFSLEAIHCYFWMVSFTQ